MTEKIKNLSVLINFALQCKLKINDKLACSGSKFLGHVISYKTNFLCWHKWGNNALHLVSPCDFWWQGEKHPHLSPQHYNLNVRGHVLDQTRVLVLGNSSKVTKKQAWEKLLCRTNCTTHDQPCFQKETGKGV